MPVTPATQVTSRAEPITDAWALDGSKGESATLRLRRDVGSVAFELRGGRFEISVDGKPVGSLANHDTAETQIEPGRHNPVLRKGRYSSRTLREGDQQCRQR